MSREAIRDAIRAGNTTTEAIALATGLDRDTTSRVLADLRRAGMVERSVTFTLTRDPQQWVKAEKGPKSVINGKTAKIRAALTDSSGQTAEALRLRMGFPVYRLLRRMVDLGYATAEGEPLVYTLTDKPNPKDVKRTPEEKRAAQKEAQRRWLERNKGKRLAYNAEWNRKRREEERAARPPKPPKPKPEPVPVPRVPKPKAVKPEQVRVKRTRVVTDIAFTPSAAKLAPADKAALPDTEAWIRQNADKVIRLKPGECSVPRDAVTARQRQTLLSLGECA